MKSSDWDRHNQHVRDIASKVPVSERVLPEIHKEVKRIERNRRRNARKKRRR